MRVFEKEVKELIPYEFNNKIHDTQQINRIANSIKEFGFTQPIVIDKNNVVIIGHGRLEASKKLNLSKVPVVMMDELTENQIKKLRILDNKLNESQRDEKNLKVELDILGDLNFGDLELSKEDLFPDLFKEIEEKEEPEIKFTEELGEENNYLVLFFDDSIDRLQAQSLFGLETVDALDSKEGYRRRGVGRVINGTEFMKKLLAYYNKDKGK